MPARDDRFSRKIFFLSLQPSYTQENFLSGLFCMIFTLLGFFLFISFGYLSWPLDRRYTPLVTQNYGWLSSNGQAIEESLILFSVLSTPSSYQSYNSEVQQKASEKINLILLSPKIVAFILFYLCRFIAFSDVVVGSIVLNHVLSLVYYST